MFTVDSKKRNECLQVKDIWLKYGICDDFYELPKEEPIPDAFYEKLVG